MQMWLLLALLICIAPHWAFAQDSSSLRNTFGISFSFGAKEIGSHDNVGSPLIYSGWSYPIGAELFYQTPRSVHSLRLEGVLTPLNGSPLSTSLSTEAVPRKAYFGQGQLRYQYLHWMNWVFNPFEAWFGGTIDADVFLRDYKYYGTNLYSPLGSASGEALLTADVSTRMDYSLTAKSGLSLALNLSLFGLIWRPPFGLYNRGSESRVAWATHLARFRIVGQFFSERASLSYGVNFAEHYTMRMALEHAYYYLPTTYWYSAENSFGLMIGLRRSF